MKKLSLLSLLLLSTTSFAEELHHYSEVKSAVNAGKPIHIIIDYSKCTLPSGDKVPMKMTGSVTPSEMIINDSKEYMTTSLTHFTLSYPAFPGKGVYEFTKYTISADDNLIFSTQVLDAVNYVPLKDKMELNCKLGESVKVFS